MSLIRLTKRWSIDHVYDAAPYSQPSPSPFSIVREYLYNKTPNPINIILKQKNIINWGVCINCQLICHRIKKMLNKS